MNYLKLMYVEKVAFKVLRFVPYFKANDVETTKRGSIHVNKIGMPPQP